MIRQLTAVWAASGAIVIGAPAIAAQCADRETVVERLAAHYDEQPTAAGLQTEDDSQALVEIWSSQNTGTFTVMMTMPDGMTCIVASGTDWHQKEPGAPVLGSAS
ncbi:hypothetical protein FIU85_11880 [Roseovarius sp. THAF8]|uniref:hypothetical protein n=1 Tax=Roseovarius sp. THAF8 TaxID=2587846 RepID=UPI001268A349|nr:hypothetical protein [Roseovarius sp. THAF8]QFT98008.1 hypothetical protein FIU85_11880 [Roseovarius sp. THAF8]